MRFQVKPVESPGWAYPPVWDMLEVKEMRFQVELDEKRLNELEVLMKEIGVSTKKDMFNWALTILEWCVKERKQGRIIASVDEKAKKMKELDTPIFGRVVA